MLASKKHNAPVSVQHWYECNWAVMKWRKPAPKVVKLLCWFLHHGSLTSSISAALHHLLFSIMLFQMVPLHAVFPMFLIPDHQHLSLFLLWYQDPQLCKCITGLACNTGCYSSLQLPYKFANDPHFHPAVPAAALITGPYSLSQSEHLLLHSSVFSRQSKCMQYRAAL